MASATSLDPLFPPLPHKPVKEAAATLTYSSEDGKQHEAPCKAPAANEGFLSSRAYEAFPSKLNHHFAIAAFGDQVISVCNLANLLQRKVNELNVALEDANESLENKDRMLALDKDFLSHDRDIRDQSSRERPAWAQGEEPCYGPVVSSA